MTELPPGLENIQKRNKVEAKAQKTEKVVVKEKRDHSPKRDKAKSKIKDRVAVMLNRNASFRVYSQRLSCNLTDKCKLTGKRKLVFTLPKLFCPRFEDAETKHRSHYSDDTIFVHQYVDGEKETLYRLNLNEISVMYQFNWTTVGHGDDSNGDSSGDYEPESFMSFLSRTTDDSVTCDHICNENEHWHLEMDVDRPKHRISLKKITFTLKKA